MKISRRNRSADANSSVSDLDRDVDAIIAEIVQDGSVSPYERDMLLKTLRDLQDRRVRETEPSFFTDFDALAS